MATKTPPRRHPARRHCRCFDGTSLVGIARAGLGALRAEHAVKVVGDDLIGCSVNLDEPLRETIPEEHRWDYVLVLKGDPSVGIGMEDHHASPTEVETMIAKQEAARALLTNACPALHMEAWLWISASDEILLTRNTPAAHRLAEAGIAFPRPKLILR